MPPPYSTDLTAAWLVVEHLREQGWWVRISYQNGIFNDPQQAGYEVQFRHVSLNRLSARQPSSGLDALQRYGWAVTLPEAICVAALEVARARTRGDAPHAR
jgi:hypothetical protein